MRGMPSVISHQSSDPKAQKCKNRKNPTPYNLSNNLNKIKSLKIHRVLQNPNGENQREITLGEGHRLLCMTMLCLHSQAQ